MGLHGKQGLEDYPTVVSLCKEHSSADLGQRVFQLGECRTQHPRAHFTLRLWMRVKLLCGFCTPSPLSSPGFLINGAVESQHRLPYALTQEVVPCCTLGS